LLYLEFLFSFQFLLQLDKHKALKIIHLWIGRKTILQLKEQVQQ